jgi:hypothetical protein
MDKECFKCNRWLPLTEFYKHSQMADGHLNKCKECNKKDVRKNRDDRITYYREYDVRRFHNDERRRATHEKCSKAYTRNHPERRSARGKAQRALRAGKLTKTACEKCGSLEVQMHHPDYSQPLNVTWLCKICHEAWHKEHGDCETPSSYTVSISTRLDPKGKNIFELPSI